MESPHSDGGEASRLLLPADAASPSLALTGRAGGAAELKFVVSGGQARDVKAWARRHLAADPHADAALDDSYRVNSLYLDTPALDVFHRAGLLGRRKYRLRRYGEGPVVWLELKRKRHGLVRKHRTAVGEAELAARLAGVARAEWTGAWFGRRIERYSLRPVSCVSYRRFARLGRPAGGTVRLTLDDEIRGRAAAGWHVPASPADAAELLPGSCVLELKFRGTMPAVFRGLVMDLGLTPGSFSKYRESAAESVPLSRLFLAEAAGAADA